MSREHLIRVTTWAKSPGSFRWYESRVQDFWLEPPRVVKSPILMYRDPDVLEKVDREIEKWYMDKDEGEREWIGWWALPFWRRAITRRPKGMKPLFRKNTLKQILNDEV